MTKMKLSGLLKLFAATVLCAFVACSDDDPVNPGNGDDPDMTDLYEVKDAALRDYLIYNSGLSSGETALPEGLVKEVDGKSYIVKSVAATVTTLDLSQPFPGTATVGKIGSLDGIQLFTDLQSLDITDNSVTGSLDLSKLTALKTVMMDGNLASTLSLPPSVTKLHYAAAGNATDAQKLTAINLGQLTRLAEVSLPDHKIASDGLVLPALYPDLKYIDLSGNDGAPFEIPEALYDQLETKEGVDIVKDMTNYVALTDKAFGDYLIYNGTLDEGNENKLPANLVMVDKDTYYLQKEVAATVKRLSIAKDSDSKAALTTANVATADDAITNLAGIEYFTALETFIGTGNNFGATLKTDALTKLTQIEASAAGVSKLDLSKNTALETLIVPGGKYGSYTYGNLAAIDLSKNVNLKTVNLTYNSIDPAQFTLPTVYTKLATLLMEGNFVGGEEISYEIAEDLYDALTEKSGVAAQGDDPDYTGPTPQSQYIELNTKTYVDQAGNDVGNEFYAKYLVLLSQGTNVPSALSAQALPEGTAVKHTDDKYYLNKVKAAEATVLNINLLTATATALNTAGLTEASSAMASGLVPALEGIEYFTNITELTATNCRILGSLDLSNHTKLTTINMDGAKVNELKVPAGTVRLSYQGWRDSKDVRLRAIDLSACANIAYLRFDRHLFTQEGFVLPAACPDLTYLRLGDRTVNGATITEDGVNLTNVTITIPAAIYDGLTSTDGNNKVGVTKGE